MSTEPNPAAWYQFSDGGAIIDFYGDSFPCDHDEIQGLIEYLQALLKEET